MSTDDRESKSNFKVVDKRRFDTAGNERDDEKGSNPSVRPQPAQAKLAPVKSVTNDNFQPDPPPQTAQASQVRSAPMPEGDEADITFSSFVISLATQALMQLGQIPSPDGVQVPVDREAAKQTIDIIGMLQRKTSGNLEQEEAKLVEEILHNLRLGFVKSGTKK